MPALPSSAGNATIAAEVNDHDARLDRVEELTRSLAEQVAGLLAERYASDPEPDAWPGDDGPPPDRED